MDLSFFQSDAVSIAKMLLGKKLSVDGKSLIITETESYLDEQDKASHARFGRTTRSSILYEPGGILYVYLIYGMYYCTNIVVGPKDHPSAVLLRAGIHDDGTSVNGPGRFSRDLGITTALNGASLIANPVLSIEDGISVKDMKCGPRIGVGYAGEWAEKPFRFWI